MCFRVRSSLLARAKNYGRPHCAKTEIDFRLERELGMGWGAILEKKSLKETHENEILEVFHCTYNGYVKIEKLSVLTILTHTSRCLSSTGVEGN